MRLPVKAHESLYNNINAQQASRQTQSCQTDVLQIEKALKVSCQAYTPAMHTLACVDIPCEGFCACTQQPENSRCISTTSLQDKTGNSGKTRDLDLAQKHKLRLRLTQS